MNTRPTHAWVFDENFRFYRVGESAPIWREHWRKMEVVGETSRSWILSDDRKVPKKGGRGIAFSEAEVDRLAWAREHAHKILNSIDRYGNPEQLDKIAALVNYPVRMPR